MPADNADGSPPGRTRLAYLVSKYPSENHTYILREVAGLRDRGIDVEVVAITPDDRSRAEVSPAEAAEQEATFAVKRRGVAGVLLDNLAVLARHPAGYVRGLRAARRLAGADLKRFAYHLAYLAEAAVVGRWVERRGHRHLHVHYASTVGLLVGEVFRVRVSATIHGSAEFIDPVLQHIREKVRALDFVVAISKYGRSQLMYNSDPAYWHKIHVVPLGVDTTGLAPERTLSSGDAGRTFELSCVGQLQPAKGVHVLLDAVALLAARGRRVRLTLVGDGPYKASLGARARELGIEVVFTGRLGQAEVSHVYARSDAFVLASFAEGVPVVLMEAMRHGVPCVATRITGIPELIRDGVDGLLVTPSDVYELAGAIQSLLDDRGLASRLARSAQTRVREHYDLATNVATLARIYKRRLGDGVGGAR